MAGRAKENLHGGSLKYQCVYLNIRIFRCSITVPYLYHIYTIFIPPIGGTFLAANMQETQTRSCFQQQCMVCGQFKILQAPQMSIFSLAVEK